MIVKQELISKIKDYFGLNVYETKVWLALLGKGIASAGEVADLSGVPRSRTYDVLESLEKRGFAIIKLGKPVKYIGIKPQVILEKLKNNVKQEAKERIVGLSTIKETDEFQKLEEIYKGGINPVRKEDLSASLKGKANISTQLREILENAKTEVLVCLPAEELKLKLRLFKETFEKLIKNGVKIKVALSGDMQLSKQLSELFNMKFKRIEINAKFFIIDRAETLFYVSKSTDEEDIAVWLNSEFFSQSFAALFDTAVKGGK